MYTSKHASMRSDTFWLLTSRIASAIGTSVFVAIIANMFTARQVGLLTWIRNVGAIIGIIATLSAYANSIYFNETTSNRSPMVSSFLNMVAVFILVLLIAWMFLYWPLQHILDCSSYPMYLLIGLMILSFVLYLMVNSISISLQQFILLSSANVVIALSLIVGSLIIALFDGIFYLVLMLFCVSYAIGIAYQLVCLIGGSKYSLTFDIGYLKRLYKYISTVSLGEVLYMLMFKMDVIMLSIFFPLTEVGIYGVAVLIAETLMYLPQSVKTILLPRLGASKISANSIQFKIYYFYSVGLTLCGAICISCVGLPVIVLIFGEEFRPAYTVMLILLLGILARSGKAIVDSVLLTSNKIRFYNWCAIISIFFFTLLSLLLIPKYRLIGAALSCTLSYMLASFLTHYYFYVKILRSASRNG